MKRMQRPPLYPPLSCGLWILLLGVGLFFMVLLYFQVLTAGFARLGLSSGQVLLVIVASFVGSGVNIPVKSLRTEKKQETRFPSFLGMHYRVPVRQQQRTVLASILRISEVYRRVGRCMAVF
jgi:uncharacterized membrane protein